MKRPCDERAIARDPLRAAVAHARLRVCRRAGGRRGRAVMLDPRLEPRAVVAALPAALRPLVGPLDVACGRRAPDDLPSAALAALVELVIGGVLEVEVPGAGFVTGAAAVRALDLPEPPVDGSPSAALSVAALRHGEAFVAHGLSRVARALYHYPRFPSRHAMKAGGARATGRRHADWLTAVAGGVACRWRPITPVRGAPWIHWRLARAAADHPPFGAVAKLYVSPVPDDLPGAWRTVIETLPAYAPLGLKTVACLPDASRPDKLIAYFADPENVLRAAQALGAGLTGLRAHGVPFTTPVARDLLLSWAVDPPAARRRTRAAGRESWRQWIVDRIAVLLCVGAVTGDDGIRPWQFARIALHASGIDVGTWQARRRPAGADPAA
jgi:hypothetical protein